MTLTEIYTELPDEVTDEDGDVWTRARDGRYSLGADAVEHGDFTLAGIQRTYGIYTQDYN